MLHALIILAGVLSAPVALTAASEFDLSHNPESLGGYVREFYSETPILAEIAWCESRFRHLNKDGEIFRGKINKSDVGVMQVNTYYHEEKAEELGLDLYSLRGNLEYAKYLYEKEGTTPWNSSKPCWGKGGSTNAHFAQGKTMRE